MGEEKHLENLQEIRSMMERNTRFLSLSGLSGIFAGMCGLAGGILAYFRIEDYWMGNDQNVFPDRYNFVTLKTDLMLIAIGVLVCALVFAYFFTHQKAKKTGEKVWNKTSKRILLNLSIPILTGGFLVLVFLSHDLLQWVAPFALIFYGLACISASQQTVRDIFYLGLTCLILGLVNTLFLGYGLLFWSLGFGIAHIIYGALMYFKYDRKA